MTAKRPFHTLPRSQQAGILCAQTNFREFVDDQTRHPSAAPDTATTEQAAAYVRTTCDVPSRARLNSDETAAARFDALRTEFDAWRGKIPAQK